MCPVTLGAWQVWKLQAPWFLLLPFCLLSVPSSSARFVGWRGRASNFKKVLWCDGFGEFGDNPITLILNIHKWSNSVEIPC